MLTHSGTSKQRLQRSIAAVAVPGRAAGSGDAIRRRSTHRKRGEPIGRYPLCLRRTSALPTTHRNNQRRTLRLPGHHYVAARSPCRQHRYKPRRHKRGSSRGHRQKLRTNRHRRKQPCRRRHLVASRIDARVSGGGISRDADRTAIAASGHAAGGIVANRTDTRAGGGGIQPRRRPNRKRRERLCRRRHRCQPYPTRQGRWRRHQPPRRRPNRKRREAAIPPAAPMRQPCIDARAGGGGIAATPTEPQAPRAAMPPGGTVANRNDARAGGGGISRDADRTASAASGYAAGGTKANHAPTPGPVAAATSAATPAEPQARRKRRRRCQPRRRPGRWQQQRRRTRRARRKRRCRRPRRCNSRRQLNGRWLNCTPHAAMTCWRSGTSQPRGGSTRLPPTPEAGARPWRSAGPMILLS